MQQRPTTPRSSSRQRHQQLHPRPRPRPQPRAPTRARSSFLSPLLLILALVLPLLSIAAYQILTTTTTQPTTPCLPNMPCKQNLNVPESWRSGLGPLNMIQKPPFTVDAPGAPKIDGETKPRRNLKAKDALDDRPSPEVDTVFALVKQSTEEHAGDRCIGTRKLIKIHEETKKVPKVVDGETQMVDKKWQYFELSNYTFITYGEYETHLLNLASGLRHLGLGRGDKVHMFASTSANWLALSHACSSQTFAIVTAYDTLGADGVEHTLVQSKPKVMFTDPHLLKTASRALSKADTVKIVVYNDQSIALPTPQSEIDAFKSSHPNLTVLSVSELASLGEENPYDPVPPTPQDMYCIMYTSGSTGPPKGVSMTHEGFVAAVAGLVGVIGDSVSPEEVVLAYLPLAHIFEMVVENIVFYFGATMGYGSARTLSDQNVRNCMGDMRSLAPTILVGVPQVWETIKKGVMGRVNGGSLLVRSLFWGAFNTKSFLVSHNLPLQTIFDRPIFGQVRKLTGGRLRFIINGASGISKETAHFMSMIVAPMLVGYGLTETGGNGAVTSPQQFRLSGSCGPLSTAVECKLVSISELNYSTSTTPPQGEVWLRGKPVLKEYYNNPEETAKAVTADGWFKTGDIGEFDDVGHLKIIDRVKNLVKLQGGEYIALEKLEATYRGSRAVQNLMIHGDSDHPRPIAVIFVSEPVIREIAAGLGVSGGAHELVRDHKVRGAVFKDLVAQGRNAGLTGLETISGVVLTDEEWTPESGLVTGTQKLQRRAIRERYAKEIKEAFKGS